MKHLHIYIFIIAAFLLVPTSCDDGFDELNQNPNAANEIDPGFQFSFVQLGTSGGRYENWRAALIYSSMMNQHMAALCGYWSGDKYSYNAGYASSLFDRAYGQEIKDLQDLINTLQTTDTGDATMLAQARIWRVHSFQRLTDMYGDIPYSEAGKGFLEQIDFPKYDTQEFIYNDMIKELQEAIPSLGSGGFGAADFAFGGDVDKWRKFGYSMMLRIGMRLSEVDPGLAQSTVAAAIAGGVMTSNDDIVFIEHQQGPSGINRNGIGEVLDKSNGFGDDCPRMSATFINWMKERNDPRIDIVAVPPVNGGEHNGLPNGLDNTTLQDNPTGTSLDDFSSFNPELVRVESPMVFMTYAEVELLLAEAAVRGWHNGDAATHYNNGVRAAMQQYGIYGQPVVDDATVDAYLAANPFDMGNALSQIGWQYWAATYLNEYESFSNWRRTGTPELVPVDYPGNVTGGQIPLRLVYPQGAAGGGNADVFNAALSNQGLSNDFASHMTVPVWWDK